MITHMPHTIHTTITFPWGHHCLEKLPVGIGKGLQLHKDDTYKLQPACTRVYHAQYYSDSLIVWSWFAHNIHHTSFLERILCKVVRASLQAGFPRDMKALRVGWKYQGEMGGSIVGGIQQIVEYGRMGGIGGEAVCKTGLSPSLLCNTGCI